MAVEDNKYTGNYTPELEEMLKNWGGRTTEELDAQKKEIAEKVAKKVEELAVVLSVE